MHSDNEKSHAPAPTQKRVPVQVLLIVLASLAVFSDKFCGQFLSDDFYFNARASSFVFSAKSLMTLGVFERSTFFYRPVPVLMWVLLYKLVGLVPVYYHVATLSLHIINCVLVFFLLKKVFQENVAFISACIFSVFTGHIQAVQWVSGIFDVVCTLFFLLSILLLVSFLESRRLPFYLGSLVFAILSIFSKEMAATLPVIVLGLSLVWFWKRGFNKRRILSAAMISLPYFVLQFCYTLLRIQVLYRYRVETPDILSLVNVNVLKNYTTVLGSLIYPNYSIHSISAWLPLLIDLFLVLSILCFCVKRESRRALSFGLAWVLVTAAPALVMIEKYALGDLVTNRFSYLPSVGFCLMLGQMLSLPPKFLRRKRLTALLPCAAVALYSVNTIYHGHYWTEAWRSSKEIQASFQSDVKPLLKTPAKANFFRVPELLGRVGVFFTGLSECFSLLGGGDGYEHYPALEWAAPYVKSVEDVKPEGGPSNYYFFEWDSSRKRFRQFETVVRGSGAPGSGGNILFSWDFSQYDDLHQWEPAHELSVVFDRTAGSHRFITTGNFSFLKSPFLGRREVKYVQIVCRAENPRKVPLTGQLFWVGEDDVSYNEKNSIAFPVQNDRFPHTYTVPLYANAWLMREPVILRIAVRLSNHPNTTIDVKSITLYSF